MQVYRNPFLLGLAAITIAIVLFFITYNRSSDTQWLQNTTDLQTTAPNNTLLNAIALLSKLDLQQATPLVATQSSELAFTTETLKQTQIDGRLELDAQGHFIANKHALNLFDYFLLVKGEIGEAQAIAYIREYINAHLPAPAATEAMNFLQQYLNLRNAAKQQMLSAQYRSSPAPYRDSAQIGEQYKALRKLRTQIFGAALSEQLFDEKTEALQMQRLQVMFDNNLSNTQKGEKLQAIIAQLPKEQAAFYLKMEQQNAAQIEITKKLDAGATSKDIWEYRASLWGNEAADRLAALDEKNLLWQKRLNSYHLQKSTIESDSTLSAPQKMNATQILLRNNFSDREKQRVQALENIQQQAQHIN